MSIYTAGSDSVTWKMIMMVKKGLYVNFRVNMLFGASKSFSSPRSSQAHWIDLCVCQVFERDGVLASGISIQDTLRKVSSA